MAIDIYFSNRTLNACTHALCRVHRGDVHQVVRWAECPGGGRRDEQWIRVRAGAPPPVLAGLPGSWPAGPTPSAYAVRALGAEYSAEGELTREGNPPRFDSFVTEAQFVDTVRQARDAELVTGWTGLQNEPAPPGTRFTSRAAAVCHECLVKDLAWTNCSPRLCTSALAPSLAAGLAIALDRGMAAPAPGGPRGAGESISELLGNYEIKPHAPTPQLDRVRVRRVLAEPLEEDGETAAWPDDHPTANGLLEALVFRDAPIVPDEAGFLLAKLLVLTYLLSQTVEEQDGQIKRVAYRALTILGTYIRCLRIAQRFGLEMYLVTA